VPHACPIPHHHTNACHCPLTGPAISPPTSIIDYQHDVADVVGGALLGTQIALVYLLRAIPRWKRVLEAEHGAAALGGAAPGGSGVGRAVGLGSEERERGRRGAGVWGGGPASVVIVSLA
jgi:hypothetical protein